MIHQLVKSMFLSQGAYGCSDDLMQPREQSAHAIQHAGTATTTRLDIVETHSSTLSTQQTATATTCISTGTGAVQPHHVDGIITLPPTLPPGAVFDVAVTTPVPVTTMATALLMTPPASMDTAAPQALLAPTTQALPMVSHHDGLPNYYFGGLTGCTVNFNMYPNGGH